MVWFMTSKKVNLKSQKCKLAHLTCSMHTPRLNLDMPPCRPIQEHSEKVLYVLIQVHMHAQWTDEIRKMLYSSLHISSIKCRMGMFHTIPECYWRGPQRALNQKFRKSRPQKSATLRALSRTVHFETPISSKWRWWCEQTLRPIELQWSKIGG